MRLTAQYPSRELDLTSPPKGPAQTVSLQRVHLKLGAPPRVITFETVPDFLGESSCTGTRPFPARGVAALISFSQRMRKHRRQKSRQRIAPPLLRFAPFHRRHLLLPNMTEPSTLQRHARELRKAANAKCKTRILFVVIHTKWIRSHLSLFILSPTPSLRLWQQLKLDFF